MRNLDFVRAIQLESGGPDGVGYIATLDRKQAPNTFREYGYLMEDEDPLDEQPWGKDVFFSPLRFYGKRSNDTAQPPFGVLFADLDGAPQDSPAFLEFKPSIMWETSPGNFQAVWRLRQSISSLTMWSNLNQRLTYALGADKGGWHASKLLRVPESVNWKRHAFGSPAQTLYVGGYDMASLNERLPQIQKQDNPLYSNHPKPLSEVDARALIIQNWDHLTLRTRSMLARPLSEIPDRSLHIVRTAWMMLEDGVQPEHAFHMIWWAEWNKWRTDRYDPARLWYEITQ